MASVAVNLTNSFRRLLSSELSKINQAGKAAHSRFCNIQPPPNSLAFQRLVEKLRPK